jgi:hypothetical protein
MDRHRGIQESVQEYVTRTHDSCLYKLGLASSDDEYGVRF